MRDVGAEKQQRDNNECQQQENGKDVNDKTPCIVHEVIPEPRPHKENAYADNQDRRMKHAAKKPGE